MTFLASQLRHPVRPKVTSEPWPAVMTRGRGRDERCQSEGMSFVESIPKLSCNEIASLAERVPYLFTSLCSRSAAASGAVRANRMNRVSSRRQVPGWTPRSSANVLWALYCSVRWPSSYLPILQQSQLPVALTLSPPLVRY
jgi:hypothetical protein